MNCTDGFVPGVDILVQVPFDQVPKTLLALIVSAVSMGFFSLIGRPLVICDMGTLLHLDSRRRRAAFPVNTLISMPSEYSRLSWLASPV
jgi:hypothetical protein